MLICHLLPFLVLKPYFTFFHIAKKIVLCYTNKVINAVNGGRKPQTHFIKIYTIG